MEDPKRKKRIIAITLTLIAVLIFIPITYLSLFIKDEGDEVHYVTFKELMDRYNDGNVKAGDTVFINDVLSNIRYNSSANYTYLAFGSMEGNRNPSIDYDAGYPADDLTDRFKIGDGVKLKVDMEQEMGPRGIPVIVGHIEWIEHSDEGDG